MSRRDDASTRPRSRSRMCGQSNGESRHRETLNLRYGDPVAGNSENLAYSRLTRYWAECRRDVERLFLDDDGPLGTQESQRDFEAFFERYMGFLKKQAPDFGLPPDAVGVGADGRECEQTGRVGSLTAAQRAAASLPRSFDQRFKYNCSSVPSCKLSVDPGLDVTLFRGVLQLYQDFIQKQAMQKIRKLQSTVKNLPVASMRQSIIDCVKDNAVVLVAGDTGCGKSTQVPQYLLEAGYQSILVTQPRRIAAVSLARRVAHERLQCRGSNVVGHQIRFDSTRSQNTRILFVTEGILQRLLEADADASDFDVIIIDEVHERHLSVDLLLGIMRRLVLERRQDLKIVLMSATLQKHLFTAFFGLSDDAVVSVPGRCFPVEVEHVELPDEPLSIRTDIIKRNKKKRTEFDCAPYIDVLHRIESLAGADERGDVLVFVPGAFEIDALVAAVADFASKTKRWIGLPLHSQLPIEQQDKVFDIAPMGVRKVIIATNIAETSITIDGVRFVVDSGKMKELDVEMVSSVRHLAERWVSQASAEQRRGRAGRTGPGRCFRLYSQRLFGEFERFTLPEIHRSNLEAPILQVLALGFSLHSFRFPEAPRLEAAAVAVQRLLLMRAAVRLEIDGAIAPPPTGVDALVACGGGAAPTGWAASFGVRGGESLLRSLGLLEHSVVKYQLVLTPLGRVLSRLPVDVGVGKMLLLSLVFSVHNAAVVLAGATGLHSPRVQRRGERSEGAFKLDSGLGDLFTTLQVYQAWLFERSRRKGGGSEQSRRWARENGIDETTLFELNKMNVQVCNILRDGAGRVDASGAGMGAKLRRDRMARLEAAISGKSEEVDGNTAGDLTAAERAALKQELEDLQQKEARRQRRQLSLDEGEGALIEDERGLGYSLECKTLGGMDSDGDLANASGGEGNPNREQNRRKRRRTDRKQRDKVRLPRNDGLSERMRRRNIEFELRYGSHLHTRQSLEPLTSNQEELLQLVVACSLYPNLAIPHEKNSERTSSECIFHTRQVPFVNLHPNSPLFPDLPTAFSSCEGLAYGAILQTHMPFLTHVTRCPILPVFLLCASSVDVSSDCKLLIFDEWLHMLFESSDEVVEMLEVAHILRRSVLCALDSEIEQLFDAECDDDVSEELLDYGVLELPDHAPQRLRKVMSKPCEKLRGTDLENRILRFWRRKPKYRWQTLMPNEYAAFLLPTTSAPDATSLKLAASTAWLRYGTISEASLRIESSLVSDHLAIAWCCPVCKHTFRFTRRDVARHRSECIGDEAHGDLRRLDSTTNVIDAGSPVAPVEASTTISADAQGVMWKCDKCTAEIPCGSTLEILRHRRSHGL